MITHQLVMPTSTRAAHLHLALLARMRSVLPVSFVTQVTENRGRGFVCTGLVVQVKVGLQGIQEAIYALTGEHADDLQVLIEAETVALKSLGKLTLSYHT